DNNDDLNFIEHFHLAIKELELDLNEHQRLLGIELLTKYKESFFISYSSIKYPKYNLMNQMISSNAEKCLSEIVQEPYFKFLCQQAYQNPHAFPIINKFTQSLYTFAESNGADTTRDAIYQAAVNNLTKEEGALIVDTINLYEESQLLMDIANNNMYLLIPTLDFNEKVINSFLSYKEKIFWVKTISNYLDEPDNDHFFHEYQKLYNHALTSGNSALRKLGISMMVLGIAIVSISLITISIAVGGPWSVGFLLLASSCLGGLGIGMGKLMHSVGAPDKLCSAFLQWDDLVKKCESDNFPYQAPQEAGYGNKVITV
ncbi:MAG: hypothetical protein Q8M40_07015, partial [Legionella sp.]|nr:hypothetical protein [Legionella sp.]